VRTNVYVDGYNLYRGCLKDAPHLKWLDLRGLAEALLVDDQQLQHLKFFTARVKDDPGAASRQQIYIRALRATRVVVYDNGTFAVHTQIRPVADRPHRLMTGVLEYYNETTRRWTATQRPRASRPLRASIVDKKEKGSDVNLAAHLMWDALHNDSSGKNHIDAAIVVSGDSDLETPIHLISSNILPVHVVNPTANRGSRELQQAASSYRSLDLSLLPTHQLPDPVKSTVGTDLVRPEKWA
jgi:uncharacterized LabA/DUF88 family protein